LPLIEAELATRVEVKPAPVRTVKRKTTVKT
jgi:hypothetical protein